MSFSAFPIATSQAIKATGTTSPRSLLDRLGDRKSVKDFGAIGNGSADDTAAIQAAVDWTSGEDRGIIFFPPGTYKATSAITFNYDGEHSIIFEGCGDLSTLSGNFNGYILDRSNTNPTGGIRVIRNLKISNAHATGGCIRFEGSVAGSVENCFLNGYRVITAIAGNSWHIQNCNIVGSTSAGAWGIMAANAVAVINCDFQACAHGIRHYNTGLQVIGGRIETCTVGIMLGQDESGNSTQSTGALVAATSMEANQTGIDLNSCSLANIIGVHASGGVSMVRGFYCHGASFSILNACATSGSYTTAGFDADCNGGLVFNGCQGASSGGGPAWLMPATAGAKIVCVGSNNPTIAVAFADLPGSPVGGQRNFITNCSHSTFATDADGGGTADVPVYYNAATASWKVG